MTNRYAILYLFIFITTIYGRRPPPALSLLNPNLSLTPTYYCSIDLAFLLLAERKKNLFVILSNPTLEEPTCNYHLYLSFLYIVSFVVAQGELGRLLEGGPGRLFHTSVSPFIIIFSFGTGEGVIPETPLGRIGCFGIASAKERRQHWMKRWEKVYGGFFGK